MQKQEYYEILGVNKNSSEGEIKKAYRKLAHKHHPDRNGNNNESTQKFKDVAEAYDVLSNPEKRQSYDSFGHDGLRQGGGRQSADPFDIFNSFFGGGRPRQGKDINVQINIELEDVLNGKTQGISFMRHIQCHICKGIGGTGESCLTCGGYGKVSHTNGFMQVTQPCRACQGSGVQIINSCKECSGQGQTQKPRSVQIDIPAGISDNVHMQLSGEGDITDLKLPPGNLLCKIRINAHKLFARKGLDLQYTQNLSFVDACLGTKIKVPTIDGELEELNIPPGTQYGQSFDIKGKGIPGMTKNRKIKRGNLFVKIHIDVPKDLTKEEKTILKQFSKKIKDRA